MSVGPIDVNKEKPITYKCSCTICGWQTYRTIKNVCKPYPKCKKQQRPSDHVFPNNPRVMDDIPE